MASTRAIQHQIPLTPAPKPQKEPARGSRNLEARAQSLVNPASGLANDYINLFANIVMMIENLPTMPDLLDDIMDWQPVSYTDYFARSNRSGALSALEAYSQIPSNIRDRFETVVKDIDHIATGGIAKIRLHHKRFGTSHPGLLADLCARIAHNLRAALTRAVNIIDTGAALVADSAQARADRLMQARLYLVENWDDAEPRAQRRS